MLSLTGGHARSDILHRKIRIEFTDAMVSYILGSVYGYGCEWTPKDRLAMPRTGTCVSMRTLYPCIGRKWVPAETRELNESFNLIRHLPASRFQASQK